MIFKAYEISGTVPEELDPDVAYGIGRAMAHFYEVDEIAVGRDARSHSPELAETLIEGIRDEGVDVVDLGLVSTPMLGFAVDHLDAGGGVIVTGAHRPGSFNGFKLVREHGVPVGEDTGLKEIEALARSRAGASPVSPRGDLRVEAVLDAYVDQVLGVTAARPELKVVIDCGNGVAGRALGPLLDRLPLEVERLYFEPDGRFPNHAANPLDRDNLADLVAAVERSGAAFGVAFDGDGSCACFVDERGELVPADVVTALIGCRQLERAPRGRILYDLRSSRAVPEEVARAGGRPDMCRSGHAHVKAQMRESGAVFAGGLSGRYFFRYSNTLVTEDGVAAFVAMLGVVAHHGEPLSKIVEPLLRYANDEVTLEVGDVSNVLKTLEQEHAEASHVSKLEGLHVRYDDWWFHLGPVGDDGALRLRVEAGSPEAVVEARDRVSARIEELG